MAAIGMDTPVFPVLTPELQVSFFYRLRTIRARYLHDALRTTLSGLELAEIDTELRQHVSAAELKRVATFGLRGEVIFCVPVVLRANPFLLGYYRLLLGMSQKEFYNRGPFGRFRVFEDEGSIPDRLSELVNPLCVSLIRSAEALARDIDCLSLSVVHELQLLTIGPQLRGSENTRTGQAATREVYDLILGVVGRYVAEKTQRTIVLRNDSGRVVLIEFSSDPDVSITETLTDSTRPILSIEVKGGGDRSNIHNRIGEAEKSHRKARNLGFFEFWTIIRVDVDEEMAGRESPTTSRFFNLERIRQRTSAEAAQFRDLLGSLVGIRPAEGPQG